MDKVTREGLRQIARDIKRPTDRTSEDLDSIHHAGRQCVLAQKGAVFGLEKSSVGGISYYTVNTR